MSSKLNRIFVAAIAIYCCATLLAQSQKQNRGGRGGGSADKVPQDHRDDNTLAPGDPAPDFTLKDLDGHDIILSSYQGKKPVFLIFGSYT